MSFLSALAGWKGYALAGGVCFIVGTSSGYYLRDLQAKADQNAALKAAVKAAPKVVARTARAADITATVGARTEREQEKTRTVYRDIIREVPVYVTAETDRRYPLPVGFVRVLDRAAGGSEAALPDGPGQSDNDPSEVAASDAAGTLVDWAGLYYSCRRQVIGWNEWHVEQRKAWDAK